MSSSHPTPKKWKPNTPHLLSRPAGKSKGGPPKATAPRAPVGEGREFGQHLHTVEPPSGTAACVFQLHSKGCPNQGSKQPLAFPNSPVTLSSEKVPEESNREKPQLFQTFVPFPGQKQREPPDRSQLRPCITHCAPAAGQHGHRPRSSPTLPQEKPARACVSPLLRLFPPQCSLGQQRVGRAE